MRRDRAYGRGCYSRYRGRSALSTPLKIIAILLAVVLVLSVAALFFLELINGTIDAVIIVYQIVNSLGSLF